MCLGFSIKDKFYLIEHDSWMILPMEIPRKDKPCIVRVHMVVYTITDMES